MQLLWEGTAMCQMNAFASLGIQEATAMLVRTESLNHELLFEFKKIPIIDRSASL
jgi:hypothetical protein